MFLSMACGLILFAMTARCNSPSTPTPSLRAFAHSGGMTQLTLPRSRTLGFATVAKIEADGTLHVKKVVADEGDTGYRNILAWLNGGELLNGWTAVAGTWNSLHHIGDMVELRFYLRSNSATSKEAFYLPEGFRIGYSQIEFQSHGTGETMAQWNIYSNGMVRLSGWANHRQQETPITWRRSLI